MGEFIILLILLVLSGFFSGSETALTVLSRVRAEAFLKEGRRGSKALYNLKSNTNRMLISILIGNNLVNIGASAMATVFATEAFGHLGPGLAVGTLTLLVLIFGEITPKTFAARYAGRISLLVAPTLLLFTRLVFPLVWILERLTVYLQGLSKVSEDPTVTESDLISMAEHGAQEGTIERYDQEMIQRIFAFNDLRARDVMIPRHKVFTLDGDSTIGQALPKIAAHPYTRIPLSSGGTEKITRVVTLREVLKEVVKGRMKKPLKKVSHEFPLFAPENQPIEQLFSTLRDDERRLVVVVDEFGSPQGVFTLEDMLEELVGEIHDEIDKQHQVYEVKKGELLVEGTEELRVVEEHLGVHLKGKPTDTVSLWLLEQAEHIPRSGEHFEINGVVVIVEKASRRKIRRVRFRYHAMPGSGKGETSVPGKASNLDHTTA
ncbi:MAG: hemolysin family protein [Pseudomonadota bacterium]